MLLRADSAFYGHATISAALTAGADLSITARMDKAIKRAIATIDDNAWAPIYYTNAIFDEETQKWISTAEVAEIEYTAFKSRKKSEHVTGRLVVRRIPDLNPKTGDGQGTLFDIWRFHAFFTTVDPTELDTVAADKTHRQHAVIAFNLTRAAATIRGSTLARATRATRATSATIRRKLIMVPARIASSARRLKLHLPQDWPWGSAWNVLFEHTHGPPVAASP